MRPNRTIEWKQVASNRSFETQPTNGRRFRNRKWKTFAMTAILSWNTLGALVALSGSFGSCRYSHAVYVNGPFWTERTRLTKQRNADRLNLDATTDLSPISR